MTVTDTRDMVLVHRVFRREFRLLPIMVRQIADEDTRAADRVSRHAREMLDALHHHHQNEDELLGPRLLQRTPAGAGLVERMHTQHHATGEILQRIDVALPMWQRTARARDADALPADIRELHTRLEEHLNEEEQQVLPIVGQTVRPAEWDELAERGFEAMPKRRALVFLGHILESASPAERSRFLKRVPPPVRLLYRLTGKRAFMRETVALRAGLAEPSPAAPPQSQGARANLTETPQVRGPAAGPHRNSTDETAHSGTLVMRVKGTAKRQSAASMRVSWAVGALSR